MVSLLSSTYLLYRDYQKARAGLARQDAMGDIMIAAYRFSEEKYHTQLELWESLHQPTAKRLEDFQMHKSSMTASFQGFAKLCEQSEDADPEITAIIGQIAGYHAQILDSWDKILLASGKEREAAQLASEELLDRFGLDQKIRRLIDLQTHRMRQTDEALRHATWQRLVFNEALIASVTVLLTVTILFSTVRDRRMARRLTQAEKLSALGQLSAGMAHELNNPLTVIRGFNNRVRYSLRKRGTVTPDIFDYLNEVDDGADRMAKIIDHLRTFSRMKDRTPVPFSVNTAIRQAFDFFEEQVRLRGIKVELQLCPEDPEVDGFSNRFEQAVINLITNARDAMGGWEQRATPTIRVTSVVEADQVVIRFADNGPGIPKKIINRVFEPFFSTKPTGAGTGLGLAIVHEIIEEHAGELSVDSQPNQGATFTIRLPRPKESRA